MNNTKVCNILLGSRELQYLLTRSSRKTVGITIEKGGTVKVTSPLRVSEAYINELLQKKSNWILKKLSEIELRAGKTIKNKVFEAGERFYYQGKEYKLKVVVSNDKINDKVKLEDEYIVLALPKSIEADKVKNILKLWYIDQFKLLIQEKVKYYSLIIGVNPQRITIREQKTRWGSCSTKGNINLNWKLIMAPIEMLDYVVIHELCHLREMNHSRDFWMHVEKFFPQHKKCRAWLKENGYLLSIE